MIKIVIDSSSYLYIVFFIFVPDVFASKKDSVLKVWNCR